MQAQLKEIYAEPFEAETETAHPMMTAFKRELASKDDQHLARLEWELDIFEESGVMSLAIIRMLKAGKDALAAPC